MAKGGGNGGCRHLGSLPNERRLSEATLVGTPRTIAAYALNSPKVPHWLCLTCFQSYSNRHAFLQHGRSAKHGLAWASQEGGNPNEYIFCVNCKQPVQIEELSAKDRSRASASITAIKELLKRDPTNTSPSSAFQARDTDVSNSNAAPSSLTGKPPGLHNLGNTCFMNASLQCLASIKCLQWREKDRCGALSTSLYTLLDCLRDPTCSASEMAFSTRTKGRKRSSSTRFSAGMAINPSHFFDQLGHRYSFFERNEQQDSHDFLRLLFNALDDEVADAKGNLGDAPHRRCLGGAIVVRVQCSRCRQVTRKQEDSLDLSLSLSGTTIKTPMSLEASLESLSLAARKTEEDCVNPCWTVTALIKNWRYPQLLSRDDAFACEKCYQLTNTRENASASASDSNIVDHVNKVVYTTASCQYAMERLPNCLLLHLQRFSIHSSSSSSSSRRRGSRHQQHFSYGKNQQNVELSLYLDPSLLLGGQPGEEEVTRRKYKLRAIIVHEGGTAESGHYVCIVSHKRPKHTRVAINDAADYDGLAASSDDHDGQIHTKDESEHEQWYRISDSSVSPISQSTALGTRNAYMVFYELEPENG